MIGEVVADPSMKEFLKVLQKLAFALVTLSVGDKCLVFPLAVLFPGDANHEDHFTTCQRWPFLVEVHVEVVEGLKVHIELGGFGRWHARRSDGRDGACPVRSQHSSNPRTLRRSKALTGLKRDLLRVRFQQSLKAREPSVGKRLPLCSPDLIHEARVAT